jgi:hypothetical protein
MFKTCRHKKPYRAIRVTEDNLAAQAHISDYVLRVGDYIFQEEGRHFKRSAGVFKMDFEPINEEKEGSWNAYRLRSRAKAALLTEDNLEDVAFSARDLFGLDVRRDGEGIYIKLFSREVRLKPGDYLIIWQPSGLFSAQDAASFEAECEFVDEKEDYV